MKRFTVGEASVRSRIDQPASGNSDFSVLRHSFTSTPFASLTRLRYLTWLPGWIRPVSGRLASEIMNRGPSATGLTPPTRSGSRTMVARI